MDTIQLLIAGFAPGLGIIVAANGLGMIASWVANAVTDELWQPEPVEYDPIYRLEADTGNRVAGPIYIKLVGNNIHYTIKNSDQSEYSDTIDITGFELQDVTNDAEAVAALQKEPYLSEILTLIAGQGHIDIFEKQYEEYNNQQQNPPLIAVAPRP